MEQKSVNKKIRIWLFVTLFFMFEDVFLENSCIGPVSAEYPKACAHLKCKRGDQCVSRKFWCKFPPCPNMLYCSKSRKESLKGPTTCEDVRCSKGFVCLVRARLCRWDEECEQQIARCVSERDFFEGPASCVDFHCPSGHRCILRESLCAKPPCKLLKSCAESKEVRSWLQKCRNLGCLSEHECFLRRPQQNCNGSSCKHTPDCSAKSEEELEEKEQCRGWVCPKGEECRAESKGPCKRESCRISRSCHKPFTIPVNTSPSPPHVWRDDIKLSFYTKQETNSSGQQEMKNIPLRSNGQVVKPTVTSLTTWLNYLKSMTGVEAVETWVKKADREENYQEFLEWLESVKDMLGSAAYDLWLEEVRAMTMTNVAFQRWLPPSPTNRSTDSNYLHRQDSNIGDVSHEGREMFPGSEHLNKYRNSEYRKSLQFENDYGRGGLQNIDIENSRDLFLPRNEIAQFDVRRNNENPQLPGYPMSPPWTGTNDRSPLYPTDPTILQQNQPFGQHFPNIASWQPGMHQAFPYQDYDNTPSFNPPYPPFPSNWSFPQPPKEHPLYLDPKSWQEQLFPPAYPQWQQDANERDAISPDQRVLQSPIDPPPMYPPFIQDPMNFYPQNSTYPDISWMKSFNEPYGSSELSTPPNFESYPIADRNFNYPNWPETTLPFVSHHRSKHQDSQPPEISYDNGNSGSLEENLPSGRQHSYPYYSGYPWEFKELRKRQDYLRFLDYTRRNLYDKNNQAAPPGSSTLSRTHRVDEDPFLSSQDPYIPANKVNPPQYHWNSYPNQRFHPISGNRSPSFGIPSFDTPENRGRMATSAKRSLVEDKKADQLTRRFFGDDRLNDVPGQPMELPYLWNSRYRHPSNWFFRKHVTDQFHHRNSIPRDLPNNSPSNVPSSRRNSKPRITPVKSKSIGEEKVNKHEDVPKNSEDYSVESDDGIFPLLLNLQGYIESPTRQIFQESSNPSKNSTILPVYTIEATGQDNDDQDDENFREHEATNFFRDQHYGGRSDFPNNLENAFQVEAASIMQNRTGDGDVKVNDVKWEYEYDDDPTYDNLSNSYDDDKLSDRTNDGSSNEEAINGWAVNRRGVWNDDRSGSDYYDERVDYLDDVVPEDGSSFDSDRINIDSPSDREIKSEDDPNDHHLYDDVEHKTFKKNRPL